MLVYCIDYDKIYSYLLLTLLVGRGQVKRSPERLKRERDEGTNSDLNVSCNVTAIHFLSLTYAKLEANRKTVTFDFERTVRLIRTWIYCTIVPPAR